MSSSYWESQSLYLNEYMSYFQKDKDIERFKRLLKTLKYKEEFLNNLIEYAEKQLLHEKGMSNDGICNDGICKDCNCKEYMKTTKYHVN
jgi:hypothetical protein